jgi:hypothetical protein
MPKWGLTADQRERSPWGLSRDLLLPSKTITDPVHRDIYLTEIERQFLDSTPMQRLRRVKQLGTTDLVYPGATHTRFAHSLGTLRAAQNLLDAVLDQRNGPRPKPDLFGEWWSSDVADPERKTFNKWIAEATVLTRLGGLLHDFCHVPFGHSIEDDLGILDPHDANDARFERLWSLLPVELSSQISAELKSALNTLVVSKQKQGGVVTPKDPNTLGRYAFVFDIVGNTICADLLDYLARDHLYTGLPARFGSRFLDGFYVTPSSAKYNGGRVAIRIKRDANIRADVITELFKFLRFRYELSERVLVHHAKLSADAMLGKALEIWYDSLRASELKRIKPDVDLTSDIDDDLAILKPKEMENVDGVARGTLEAELTSRSDDGLLEFLRDQAEPQPTPRMQAVKALVDGVLERRLFRKSARSADQSRPMAGQVYAKFGRAQDRRRLERECAIFARLEHRWHVLVWIPAPPMRMKAADVLVDDDDRILPLNRASQRQRGQDIYEAHEALWAVTVYVHESVTALQEEIVQAWLTRETGLGWAENAASASPSALTRLASRETARDLRLAPEQEEALAQRDLAASSGIGTFADLLDMTRAAATELHAPEPRGRQGMITPTSPRRRAARHRTLPLDET